MFLLSKLQCIYPQASIKDVQATGEASEVLKREHTAHQNMKFRHFFLLCGSFLTSSIRNQPSKICSLTLSKIGIPTIGQVNNVTQ